MVQNFLVALNIPSLHHKSMGALEDVMGKKVIELVELSCEDALAKEKECSQAGNNTVQGIGYTFSYRTCIITGKHVQVYL